jgi:hypothetical protein
MIVPVLKAAPGIARNTTASATSSGVATLPHVESPRMASPFGPASAEAAISVSVKPGATTVTEMPAEHAHFPQLPLCLSRACLGKSIDFEYKNGSKQTFPAPSGPSALARLCDMEFSAALEAP